MKRFLVVVALLAIAAPAAAQGNLSIQGDITSVGAAAGGGLTGGSARGAALLGLLTSCASGEILKWSGSAWACAADANGGTSDGDKGDITVSASGSSWVIDAAAVTLAKMANLSQSTIIGRAVSAGTGVPQALTATQATAILDTFATGATTKGLVPGSNSAGATAYLNGTGAWTVPAGAGDITDVVAGNGLTGGATSGSATVDVACSTGLTCNANDIAITSRDFGDVTTTSSGSTWTIDNSAVTLAKMADIATARILGRVTASTGVVESLTGTQATTLLDPFTTSLKGLAPASGGGSTNYLRADGTWAAPVGSGVVADGDKGDVTVSSSGTSWIIDAGVVTLAKMADVATARFIGRTTAGTGVPEALTATQATAMLNTFTTSLQGLAPASGGGTTNYLRADGTWVAPAGSGDITDVVAGNGLTGGATSGSATVDVAVGTGLSVSANQIDLNLAGASCSAGSYMSALGSTGTGTCTAQVAEVGDISNVSVTGPISGGGSSGSVTIGLTACATNEIYKYNGSAWACAADSTGSGESTVAGAGLTLTGSTVDLVGSSDFTVNANDLDLSTAVTAPGSLTVATTTHGIGAADFDGLLNVDGLILSSSGGYITQDQTLGFAPTTNATATGYINYYGYAPANTPGVTQFRDLILGDGKGATACTLTGSTKLLNCVGGLQVNGASVLTGLTTSSDFAGTGTAGSPLDMSTAVTLPGTLTVAGASNANTVIATNSAAGQTTSPTVFGMTSTGTYNTTGGALVSYGGSFENTATRSAGGNNLTNFAIYTSASGGQVNYAYYGAAGLMYQNGAATLGGTLNAQGAVDFDSTLGVDGSTTLGDAGADTLSVAATATFTPLATFTGGITSPANLTTTGSGALVVAGNSTLGNASSDITSIASELQVAGSGVGKISSKAAGAITFSSCGTSPGFTGDRTAVTVTTGSGATGCTVNFGNNFTSTPTCTVMTQSATKTYSYVVSTSAVTISTAQASTKYDIICMDHF